MVLLNTMHNVQFSDCANVEREEYGKSRVGLAKRMVADRKRPTILLARGSGCAARADYRRVFAQQHTAITDANSLALLGSLQMRCLSRSNGCRHCCAPRQSRGSCRPSTVFGAFSKSSSIRCTPSSSLPGIQCKSHCSTSSLSSSKVHLRTKYAAVFKGSSG